MGGDPNSATSQWFINLANNASALDGQNGGFTVFGRVIGSGMAVVDAIAAVPIFNAGGVFSDLPLINYTAPNEIRRENLVFTTLSASDVTAITPSVLLRRSRDRRWFSYKLRFDRDAVEIEQKGSVRLARDAAFKTVSRSDFDGDGEPDVLLREMAAPSRGSAGAVGTAIAGGTVAAGRWRLATLVGRKVISDGAVDLTADADFKLISTADFDGDGRADVLLRNAVDGRWRLYLLEAQTVKSELALDLSTSLTDTPVGTADFNNDGRADVLVRRANGTWLLYVLDSDGRLRRRRFHRRARASCRWQVAPLPARRSESPVGRATRGFRRIPTSPCSHTPISAATARPMHCCETWMAPGSSTRWTAGRS